MAKYSGSYVSAADRRKKAAAKKKAAARKKANAASAAKAKPYQANRPIKTAAKKKAAKTAGKRGSIYDVIRQRRDKPKNI